MRRFISKLTLFLLPFFLAIFVELFVLPIDLFTFRAWESLVVRKYRSILPGLFYSNMKITKIEEGDLAHHTRFAIKKRVEWITDRYGFRKQNTNSERHKIVIIGESNIAGSTLTQKEILSEVLEDQLRVSVYPYAPVGINSFLKEKRFKENPPSIVIFAKVERELFELPALKQIKDRKWTSRLKEEVNQHRWVQTIFTCLDRISKWNMLHYFRASLRRSFIDTQENHLGGVPSKYGRIFFLQGAEANRDVPREKLEKAIGVIKSYHDAITNRRIRFIFLPIPEKENIYHEYLQTPKPLFLERLISELGELGIEAIDTQKAFDEVHQRGKILLYHTDDTHWNANGVRVTAELVKKWIEKKE